VNLSATAAYCGRNGCKAVPAKCGNSGTSLSAVLVARSGMKHMLAER